MSPNVSIVIPAYNAGAWIGKTLESVVQQTYPQSDIEVIVVDDVSADASAEVARTVMSDLELRGQVIERERNGGCGAARNTGWQAATGQWVQFLDADDLLSPHKLELQMGLAARVSADVAVIYSNWQELAFLDEQWQPHGPIHQASVDQDPVAQILQDFAFGYVGPTLIRKTFLTTVGGFDERPNLGEDITLMLQVAMAGGQFRAVPSPAPSFLYRQTPNSLWRQSIANVEAMRNLLHAFRSAEMFLRARDGHVGISRDAKRGLAWRYSRFADFFLEHDPQSFRELVDWLGRLEMARPPNLSPSMGLLTRLFGFENALRLRQAYRRRLRYGR